MHPDRDAARSRRARHSVRSAIEPLEGRQLLTAAHPLAARGAAGAAVLAASRGPVAAHPVALRPGRFDFRASTLPEVLDSRLLIRGHQVVGFVVRFTRDMAPGPASDVRNYRVLDQSRGPRNIGEVPLASATYDPAQRAVTLTPAHPVHFADYLATNPDPDGGRPSPLVDTAGDLLDSDDNGRPDGRLTAHFPRRGSSLGYSTVRERLRAAAIREADQHDGLFGSIGKALNPLSYL